MTQKGRKWRNEQFLRQHPRCCPARYAHDHSPGQFARKRTDDPIAPCSYGRRQNRHLASLGGLGRPSGWFYLNLMNLDRRYAQIFDAVTKLNSDPGTTEFVAEIERVQPSSLHAMEYPMLPAIEKTLQHYTFIRNAVECAVVACALERWRLANASYPERLDRLVPTMLKAVPLDVLDGKPLRYVRAAPDRFVLYSIGWNGKDDEGRIALRDDQSRVNEKEGDWVWQSRAATDSQ